MERELSPQGKKWSYYHNRSTLKSILNVALDVHMQITGAMEMKSPEEYLKDVSLLMWAIRHWEPSHNDMWRNFDNAVHALILETLREHRDYAERYKMDCSIANDPEYFCEGESDETDV